MAPSQSHMTIYQVDATEHTEADYKAGVDMQWYNVSDYDRGLEARKFAKDYLAKHPEVIGIRVDRNCLTEGRESLDTTWYKFRHGGEMFDAAVV